MLLVFVGGLGIIAYIVLAIIVPLEGSETKPPREMVRENVQDIKNSTTQLGKEVQASLSKKDTASSTDERHHHGSMLGALLIIVGLLFLLATILGNFSWLWKYGWPVIFIILGLVIIAIRRK